MADEVAV